MSRSTSGPPNRQTRPAGRAQRPRDSLFAAIMLVPMAVIAMLAAGKIASRRIGPLPLAQETHRRHQVAAVPPPVLAVLPSVSAERQSSPVDTEARDAPIIAEAANHAPARLGNDRAGADTGDPHADPTPAGVGWRLRDSREALLVDEALLRRYPGNVELRRVAVDAALQAGDSVEADALVREGLQLAPNDPKLWVSASSVSKARGNTGRAERELKQARELRRQQLAYVNSDADERAPAGAESPGDPDDSASQSPLPNTAAPARDMAVPRRPSDGAASLAYPPAPFMPEERTARGTAPTYRPVAMAGNDYPYRPVLDTTPSALPAPTAQSTAQIRQHGSQAVDQSPKPTASTASYRGGAGLGFPSDIGVPARPAPDPLTGEIDGDIAALDEAASPSVQAGFGVRSRSGDSGIDKLTELAVPIEAEFSPAGYGRVKIAATPTSLQAGSIGHDTTDLRRFGSGALGLVPSAAGSGMAASAYSGAIPSDQRADGVGLAASYALGALSADVGSTPLGFLITHIVGGVAFAPQISDTLRLRLTGERRALTDSVLSYAGTRDARTGTKWGGEVRTRGRADLEFDIGAGRGYIGAGGGTVAGIRTSGNSEVEAGAGVAFPLYSRDFRSVSVGLDLAYFGYRRNLRFFTLGQGGYFSPQSYVAAMVPLTYKEQVDENLSYEFGAAIGVQHYHENASPYFPNDPALQTQLVALQAGPTKAAASLRTNYPAESRTGFAGNGHVAVDYRITPDLHLGARASILRVGNFTEASGVAYARYVFSGTDTQ